MSGAVNLGTVVALGIGGVLPILVGLVTKVNTHPAAKGGALLTLSGGTGVLSQWIDSLSSSSPFLWQTAATSAVGAFVAGVSSHAAIWKHTALSNSGTPFGQSPVKNYDDAVLSPIGLSDDVDTSDLTDDGAPAAPDSPNGTVDEDFVPAHLRFES